MTVLPLVVNLNDNVSASPSRSTEQPGGVVVTLPSEPVLSIVRHTLQRLGPFAPTDAMVISRILNRLSQIERDDGVSVAIDHAREVVEILKLQRRPAR